MEIRRRSGVVCLITPLRIWLLAGMTFLAVSGLVFPVATRTVQANVRVPQPAVNVPPSVPATSSVAPDSLTPQGTANTRHRSLIRGIASWYGGVFHGRKTANGETYDENALTACQNTLPFGSLVRVVNVKNGR